jgi:hypothetical protein
VLPLPKKPISPNRTEKASLKITGRSVSAEILVERKIKKSMPVFADLGKSQFDPENAKCTEQSPVGVG